MKGNIRGFISGYVATIAVVGLVGTAAATVGHKNRGKVPL